MCLAIPMKIIRIEGDKATVEISGVKKEISVALVENPRPGDYVLIHAGYAIEKLDEDEANETLDLIKEMAE